VSHPAAADAGGDERQPPSSTAWIERIIGFAEALALERALVERIRAATDIAQPETLVWRTQRAIIVPRGMPSRDYFAKASEACVALGFPVHERDTGGDLTPQDPGVVNFSIGFELRGSGASIKTAYQRLAAPLLAFLREAYGVAPYLSAVPGAFCDGDFNIVVDGRMLGGTAQRWKLAGGEGEERRVIVLGHVALLADNDLGVAFDALDAFYAASGSDRRIARERHVRMVDIAGADRGSAGNVARALADFLYTRRWDADGG